jgi:hypothetical protein
MNRHNLNNIRPEATRHFWNEKKIYLKNKINGLVTNTNNKKIRELHGGIS